MCLRIGCVCVGFLWKGSVRDLTFEARKVKKSILLGMTRKSFFRTRMELCSVEKRFGWLTSAPRRRCSNACTKKKPGPKSKKDVPKKKPTKKADTSVANPTASQIKLPQPLDASQAVQCALKLVGTHRKMSYHWLNLLGLQSFFDLNSASPGHA